MKKQTPVKTGKRVDKRGGITPEDRQAYFELHLMRLARLVLFHRQLLEEIKNQPGWKPAPPPEPADDDAPIPVSHGVDDFYNIYRSAQRSLTIYYQQTKKERIAIKPWLEEMAVNALRDVEYITDFTPVRDGVKAGEQDRLKEIAIKGQALKKPDSDLKKSKSKSKKDRLTDFSDEYHKVLNEVVRKDS